MLKMCVLRDEHLKSRTHQKVLLEVCNMLDPLCDGVLDVNFTETLIFGRETTEEERKKLKEIWYGKDSELQEASYHIPEGFHAEIDGDMVVIKKGEKKSSWSEEDEDNLTDTCVAIRKFYHGTNGAQELIDWLKLFKDKYMWKPIEIQLARLKEECDKHWEPDGLDTLYTLYQDLKKL